MSKIPLALAALMSLFAQSALADYTPGAAIKFHDYSSSSYSSSTSKSSTPANASDNSNGSSSSSSTLPSKQKSSIKTSTYKGPRNKYKPAPLIAPAASIPSTSDSSKSMFGSDISTSSSSTNSTKTSTSTVKSSSSTKTSTKSKDTDAPPTDTSTASTTTTTQPAAAAPDASAAQTAAAAAEGVASAQKSADQSQAVKRAAGRLGGYFLKHLVPTMSGAIDAVATPAAAPAAPANITVNQTFVNGGGGTTNDSKSTPSATSSASGSVSKPVAAKNSPIKDKWALIIGVGKFSHSDIPTLRYPAKDAKDFANCLVNNCHFQRDHIRLLLDEKATRDEIMAELGDTFLPRVVHEDDLVVIYYSSHGSPANRDVKGSNFLVAYDTNKNSLYSSGIEMDTLTRVLRERVGSTRTLIITDACHSGGGADNAKDAEDSNFQAKNIDVGEGQLFIASSDGNERSWESKNYSNGVFTHHLMEVLKKNPTKTFMQLVDQMKEGVNDEVQADYGQHQTVRTSTPEKWSGRGLVIGGTPSAPKPLPDQVKKILPAYGAMQ
ncbi:MAG TPA: caspase family protein [Oculatellaceae cyanobacterium]